MSERIDTIQKHTADQLALQKHILEALSHQRDSTKLKKMPEANELVIKIGRTLERHAQELEEMASTYDASQSMLKKLVSQAFGNVAGLYDQVRDQQVSRMLRDNYTALSLASMGYTAYHAFGLAVNEDRIADLSLRHLKDLTPLLVEISKRLPSVVVDETKNDHDFPVDVNAAAQAVDNTQEAWAPSVTDAA